MQFPPKAEPTNNDNPPGTPGKQCDRYATGKEVGNELVGACHASYRWKWSGCPVPTVPGCADQGCRLDLFSFVTHHEDTSVGRRVFKGRLAQACQGSHHWSRSQALPLSRSFQ